MRHSAEAYIMQCFRESGCAAARLRCPRSISKLSAIDPMGRCALVADATMSGTHHTSQSRPRTADPLGTTAHQQQLTPLHSDSVCTIARALSGSDRAYLCQIPYDVWNVPSATVLRFSDMNVSFDFPARAIIDITT